MRRILHLYVAVADYPRSVGNLNLCFIRNDIGDNRAVIRIVNLINYGACRQLIPILVPSLNRNRRRVKQEVLIERISQDVLLACEILSKARCNFVVFPQVSARRIEGNLVLGVAVGALHSALIKQLFSKRLVGYLEGVACSLIVVCSFVICVIRTTMFCCYLFEVDAILKLKLIVNAVILIIWVLRIVCVGYLTCSKRDSTIIVDNASYRLVILILPVSVASADIQMLNVVNARCQSVNLKNIFIKFIFDDYRRIAINTINGNPIVK